MIYLRDIIGMAPIKQPSDDILSGPGIARSRTTCHICSIILIIMKISNQTQTFARRSKEGIEVCGIPFASRIRNPGGIIKDKAIFSSG